MKIITEGHKYLLDGFENIENKQVLQFIEKSIRKEATIINSKDSDPNELITINDGTTNEEVLKVLIDRMQYLQNKFPCRENAIVIINLEESLMWLNKRTQDRIKRNVEGKNLK